MTRFCSTSEAKAAGPLEGIDLRVVQGYQLLAGAFTGDPPELI